jgi:hypothetical protein
MWWVDKEELHKNHMVKNFSVEFLMLLDVKLSQCLQNIKMVIHYFKNLLYESLFKS